MIKLKINRSKTFLPLSISKGTTTQRMQKARVLNLAFYDEIQNCIKNNEIAPGTLICKLNSVIGAKLGIQIAKVKDSKSSYMSYCFNEKATSIGYMLGLPFSFYTNKIHKNCAPTFLKETQNLLNEVFNPKILKRFVALVNKGYDVKSILSFYKENISQKNSLTQESLTEFLNGKSNTEKIETLQFMRYKLMSEKNTAQASYQIEKRVEKHNNFCYERPDDYYNLDKYQFENKIELFKENLKKVLSSERI